MEAGGENHNNISPDQGVISFLFRSGRGRGRGHATGEVVGETPLVGNKDVEGLYDKARWAR